ncbi:hypothetical protein Taro_027937 [Colocasia esculenta]|uniref:serine--tRNA ligase n=1 Tax=Colocasia esculenta TaxID=4460 RepID=A0A843VF63_COLES|nr:hypothetical protein [Colocasia esculenta]
MLDINLFREEKGGNPDAVRESQRRRFASVEVVDEVIRLDKEWRQRQFELEGLRKDFNRINKEVARLKIAGNDATEMIKSTDENKRFTAEKEGEVQEAKSALDKLLETIGNLVHDSVPVSDDEVRVAAAAAAAAISYMFYQQMLSKLQLVNNAVVRTWGDRRMEERLKNHVELVELLGIADLVKGANVAGGRGFYLKGAGLLLNQALINFGLSFLTKRNYEPMQTPFFMRKDIMGKCAQLAQFDEELYKTETSSTCHTVLVLVASLEPMLALVVVGQLPVAAGVAAKWGWPAGRVLLWGWGVMEEKKRMVGLESHMVGRRKEDAGDWGSRMVLGSMGFWFTGKWKGSNEEEELSDGRENEQGFGGGSMMFLQGSEEVTGEGEDKYLIATAEQPLCAYHLGDRVYPTDVPIRYAGYSTCFRKEAGSHGRDTLGIFRVHQFEKVEQFCITSPNGNDSWDMHEEMIKNSEDFYKELKLPYQIVAIVSGALNDAAAKKYDLEGWFPASKTYRELVSCSNCTDYQARRLEIRYGQKKNDEQAKQYVHMLNSTLTATERTICGILENYQTADGVEIPEALQPFMSGITFLPFKTKPAAETKPKKSKAKGNGGS